MLCRLWEKIKNDEKTGSVPRLLHKDESLLYRTIRDIFDSDVEKVVINDYEQYEKVLELVRTICPSLEESEIYRFEKKFV